MIAEVKEIIQEINTETRPPVVVVMGHVDHGKTTLLDFIRKTKVAEKEAGGITQHIGAYSIDAPRKITFIDTPGHEAFREMRSRGASVADLGILVVAADEGVKPQTKEAIQILKSAGIPFLVAINKIDRPGKDVERVKKELADNDVLVESWSGKIPSAEVSAKTGEGMDDLLELAALMTEMEQLHGSLARGIEGVVIESHRDPKRGATATVLIRNGSLARGQFIVIDGTSSPVKMLEDFRGLPIEAAGLSDPVRVTGLVQVPAVGSEVRSFNEKQEAEAHAAATKKEPARTRHEEAEGKSYINVILKTDVSGSKEAIESVLKEMQLPDIGVRILRSEVGEINDSDMQLALSSTNVTILAFKVKVPPHLAEIAEKKSIPVIKAEIIYEMFDEFKKTIARLIPAEIREAAAGKLKVLKFFDQTKSKQIIGGRVIEGKLASGLSFRVVRKDAVLGGGKIFGLQERKTPVPEVPEGNECGLLVEADMLIAENDILEAFSEERIERTL